MIVVKELGEIVTEIEFCYKEDKLLNPPKILLKV